eukprot:5178630-Alexandrium_andersonii.AAC.1
MAHQTAVVFKLEPWAPPMAPPMAVSALHVLVGVSGPPGVFQAVSTGPACVAYLKSGGWGHTPAREEQRNLVVSATQMASTPPLWASALGADG